MTPDANILTFILKAYQGVLMYGAQHLMPFAKTTLMLLIIIDISLKSINYLILEKSMQQQGIALGRSTIILENMILYGFFIYLVFGITGLSGYAELVNAIQKGMIKLGFLASNSGMSVNDFTNPSKIATRGMEIAWNLINSPVFDDSETTFTTKLIMYLCGLTIIIAFFQIGIRILKLQITFMIVAAAGIVLVPFGVWEHTKLVFDKLKNMIVKLGLKCLFMSFIIGIADVVTRDWGTLSGNLTFQQAVYLMIGTLALSVLIKTSENLSNMQGLLSAAAAINATKNTYAKGVNKINALKNAKNVVGKSLAGKK